MPYGLSNYGEEKLQFTPFWGGSKPGCSDGLCAGFIESHNFFVLGPILVKFHIQTRLIDSFPMTCSAGWCSDEKLHCTPFHTLRQLKRDEALFPPLWRVAEFRERYGQKTACQFWGWSKFGQCATLGWGKIVLHTCFDLSKPVPTCPDLSTIQ